MIKQKPLAAFFPPAYFNGAACLGLSSDKSTQHTTIPNCHEN
jgi:hypothetical protein